jgi:hypothetical protein
LLFGFAFFFGLDFLTLLVGVLLLGVPFFFALGDAVEACTVPPLLWVIFLLAVVAAALLGAIFLMRQDGGFFSYPESPSKEGQPLFMCYLSCASLAVTTMLGMRLGILEIASLSSILLRRSRC